MQMLYYKKYKNFHYTFEFLLRILLKFLLIAVSET